MSTLTKVFVVLLVVFSIAYTSMTVSIVAQTTKWRDVAEKYEEHARIADTNLRNLIAANAAELASAQDSINSHSARISELEKQLQASKTEGSQLTAELAKVGAEKSSAEAMSRGLLAQLQVAESARSEYKKQRDELETQSVDLQRRNVDLNDRVNEQTAQIIVLQEQKRQYEQQIHILRSENEKLANESRRMSSGLAMEEPTGAAMKQAVALTPVAASPIRGEIIEIAGNILTISVGSADGVTKDMVFVVYRGGQYIGDLRVGMVDPNRSAGRLIQSAMAPKVGDEATDALRFSGSRG
ncbi:MAG: hypothetical protein AABZ47_07700 [Planctomycetota bacterium]